MTADAKQLAADYDQIKRLLKQYPGIRIIETLGDPPESYTIEYNIKGHHSIKKGKVIPVDQHKIRITIPFGYPHLPPSVKPLSPIFHPDVDPDAICVATYWKDNKSLGDLIIHIGKMICGLTYQKEEPFNPEALEWYEEHQDLLPFDNLNPELTISSADDEDLSAEEPPPALPEDNDTAPGIALEDIAGFDQNTEAKNVDQLGFSDIETISISELEFEDETEEDTGFAPPSSGTEAAIAPLIEQKKIFTAKKVLADITGPDSAPDLQSYEQQISEAIAEAEELYKKADRLEQSGEFEKAGLTLDSVANVAVDYPGLEFARNRIRESLMAQTLSDTNMEDKSPQEQEPVPKSSTKAKPKAGFKLPYKVIAIVIVLISILGAATLITVKDSNNFNDAYSHFRDAKQFINDRDFQQAKIALDESLLFLDKIIFFQKKEKTKLIQKINLIINTEHFKEGLNGRILYNGQYLPIELAQNIDLYNELTTDAEKKLESGDTTGALKMYEQANKIANQNNMEEQIKTTRQKINSLQLELALNRARKAEEEKEWKNAADTYAQALELSKTLSTDTDKNEIASRLAAASFRQELQAVQSALSSSDWQKTIEMLQRAQAILKKNPNVASEHEKAEINKLLANSRLYHTLAGAKNAFDKKEWEMAINQYKNAIYLLQDNKKILGKKADDSIMKINKTILMAHIAKEQEDNTLAVEQKNLRASLKTYQNISSLISNSKFRKDEVFTEIYNNALHQIDSLKYEIKINDKKDWLLEHYEEIFKKMYPYAKSSELSSPKVELIQDKDDTLFFAMSCVEKKQGRSFRLELNYKYDQKKNKWGIYSEEDL